jgi:hypothetical protein
VKFGDQGGQPTAPLWPNHRPGKCLPKQHSAVIPDVITTEDTFYYYYYLTASKFLKDSTAHETVFVNK